MGYYLLVLKGITISFYKFQVRVKARDKGEPVREDEATVEVRINRDRGQLRFGSQMYQTTTTENRAVGQEMTRVSASPNVSPYQ